MGFPFQSQIHSVNILYIALWTRNWYTFLAAVISHETAMRAPLTMPECISTPFHNSFKSSRGFKNILTFCLGSIDPGINPTKIIHLASLVSFCSGQIQDVHINSTNLILRILKRFKPVNIDNKGNIMHILKKKAITIVAISIERMPNSTIPHFIHYPITWSIPRLNEKFFKCLGTVKFLKSNNRWQINKCFIWDKSTFFQKVVIFHNKVAEN